MDDSIGAWRTREEITYLYNVYWVLRDLDIIIDDMRYYMDSYFDLPLEITKFRFTGDI